MKGLVLELRDGSAAVLLEDGQVVTAALDCQVGETVELPAEVVSFPAEEKKQSGSRRRWLGTLAAAVLALAVVGGGYTYTTALACSYVSVDADGASIELAVNRRGQVIDVRAVDEGSVILAQSLSGELDRMPVEEALSRTMTTLEHRGFLEDSQAPVIIGVTADNEKREAALDEAAKKAARESGAPVPVYTMDVPPEERAEAARQQQSGGRYAFENQKPPQASVQSADDARTEDRPAEPPQAETTPEGSAETTPAAPDAGEQGQTGAPAASEARPAANRPQNSGGNGSPAQADAAQQPAQNGGTAPAAPSEGGEQEPATQPQEGTEPPGPAQDQQEPPDQNQGGGEEAPPAQDPGGQSGQPGGEQAPAGPGQDGRQPGGEPPQPGQGGGAPGPAESSNGFAE